MAQIIDIQQEEYYKSLKPPGVPVAYFAGDLMHYLFAEDFATGKTVLDAGCGQGYGAYHLSLKTGKLTAIDISEERLYTAKKLFSNTNLEFLLMDVTAMQFPDSMFDLAVSFEVLEHLPASRTHRFMKEIVRVLKQNSTFIISTPNRDVYSLGSKTSKTVSHINELSAPEFTWLMEQYFRKCSFFYQFKYDRHQLDLMKKREAALHNGAKPLCWKDLVPVPVKKAIRRVIGAREPNLLEDMQSWEIKPVETLQDLDLSVIQMAVCEVPIT